MNVARSLLVLLACVVTPSSSLLAKDDPAIVRSEFLYETAPFPSVHASTIAETKDGKLVAAFFGGTHEKHADVGIWVTRFENGKWTPPVEVANGNQPDGSRLPCWNPVLFQPKEGPMLLFYKMGPNPREWWGMVRPVDADPNTVPSTRLPDGILGPIKNKPIQLANGDILSPTSTEEDRKKPDGKTQRIWKVHFERSTDNGKTWTSTGPIHDGIEFSAIQPSILKLSDTKLLAVGRTLQGVVFQVTSEDAGKTWGKMAASSLPNPNSGTDALTLADGRHLIVYNHTREPKRTPLNVALSTDGFDWQPALVLETDPGEYSYPAVIQTADGLIHITYTWNRKKVKHVVVDPTKLTVKPAAK